MQREEGGEGEEEGRGGQRIKIENSSTENVGVGRADLGESCAEWRWEQLKKQIELQGDTGSQGQEQPSYQNWNAYQDILHRLFSQSLRLEEASIYFGGSPTWSLKLEPWKALRVIHRRPIWCHEPSTY